MPRSVVGIDVGGTFTDIAVLQDGRLSVHKLPSTPQNPSLGIIQGVAEAGIERDAADFVHGSTVATNAPAGRQRIAHCASNHHGLRGCAGNRASEPRRAI